MDGQRGAGEGKGRGDLPVLRARRRRDLRLVALPQTPSAGLRGLVRPGMDAQPGPHLPPGNTGRGHRRRPRHRRSGSRVVRLHDFADVHVMPTPAQRGWSTRRRVVRHHGAHMPGAVDRRGGGQADPRLGRGGPADRGGGQVALRPDGWPSSRSTRPSSAPSRKCWTEVDLAGTPVLGRRVETRAHTRR